MRPRSALVAAVLVLMAGCGWNDDVDSRAATAGLPDVRQLIEEHEWVLDRDDSSLSVEDDNLVTLSVVGEVVSGAAPCNVYRGTFSLGGGDSVEITDVALTLRDCGASTMEAEHEFITALEAVDTVDADEGDNERLVLSGGGTRLAFRSYDADQLLTTTWKVVNVADGDVISSVLAGTEPTLTFTEDGNVVLETGCNTASSTWELDGRTLSVDAVRITRMTCDTPPGVMEQEAALVAALEAADRVEIAPGALTILDEDDSMMLIAVGG